MSTRLFNDMIFGPVNSRRFGSSLGINLLPPYMKFCNFDCIYCECGWTGNNENTLKELPESEVIAERLITQIELFQHRGIPIDTITFAGNGEPTLHPNFKEIIEDTLMIRDTLLPESKVVVLTNATMLHKDEVVASLQKVDQCMFKLDAGTEQTFQQINQPLGAISLEKVVGRIKQFPGAITIQSLFLRGKRNGEVVDNTLPNEVNSWAGLLDEINPSEVVLYSIDRPTPEEELEKVSMEELMSIAQQLGDRSFNVRIV